MYAWQPDSQVLVRQTTQLFALTLNIGYPYSLIYFVKRFKQIQVAYISCTTTTNQPYNSFTYSVIATSAF